MVIPFDNRNIEHLEQIAIWGAAHGFTEFYRDVLPPTGFLVPGVAAGFLYRTDSSVAYLDTLISNPKEHMGARIAALDEIAAAFVARGELEGFRTLVAITESKALALRAQKFKAVCVGSTFHYLVRRL